MPSPSVALLRTQSDERLVALAAAGHERAFEAIVERYRRQLLRHARRHLPDARAEDALQQALVSAWTALRRGDEVHRLRPWLHRIVHNAALNALRAPGYDYEELRATLEGSGGPAELAERRALVRGTFAALAALPERQRDALLRIAIEGRSQDEVAEQLGLSHGAVRQLVHRARTALRTAATAVVPLPLATWLATAGAGRSDIAVRVGELVAGAGGSATLAKAGAVAAIAGGAVAGPAVVHDVSERSQRPETDAAANAPAAPAHREGEVAPPATYVEAVPTDVAGSDGGDGHGARVAGRDDDRDRRSGRVDGGDEVGRRGPGGNQGGRHGGGPGPGRDDIERRSDDADDDVRHDPGPDGDHSGPGGRRGDDESSPDDGPPPGSRDDDDDNESGSPGDDDGASGGGDDDDSGWDDGDDDSGSGGEDSAGDDGDDDSGSGGGDSAGGDDSGSGDDGEPGSGSGDAGSGADDELSSAGDDGSGSSDDLSHAGTEGDDAGVTPGPSGGDPSIAPSATPQPDDDDSAPSDG